MQRRKIIVSMSIVIAVLMILATLLVGCNPKEEDSTTVTLKFVTNGGNEIDDIVGSYGDEITPPDDPTKGDAIFAGWYDNAECTGDPVSIPTVMPESSKTYYAKWEDGTTYKIEIFKQPLTLETDISLYERDDALTKTYVGATGTTLNLYDIGQWPRDVEGFYDITTDADDYVITLSGEEIVKKVYFNRSRFRYTFDANAPEGVTVSDVPEGGEAYFGTTVTIEGSLTMTGEGVRFEGWSREEDATNVEASFTMPANNVTLYGVYNVAYRDTLGGADYVYKDIADNGKVYLERVGLPMLEGTLEDDVFTFTFENGSINGKFNDALRTFSYKKDDLQGEYIHFDEVYFSGKKDETMKLTLGDYSEALLTIDDVEIVGVYEDITSGTNRGFYRFTATTVPEGYEKYATFVFDVSAAIESDENGVQSTWNAFAIQGDEAEDYWTVNASAGRYEFPIVRFDGFGTAYVYPDPYTAADVYAYMPLKVACEVFPSSFSFAEDNEFLIYYYSGSNGYYYFTSVFRYELRDAFDNDGNEMTLRVQIPKDNLAGVYDSTNSGSTERVILDGYGGAKFGHVENGEFVLDSEGAYSMELDASYDEPYTSGDYSAIINHDYYALVYTSGGSSVRFRVQSMPAYDSAARKWNNGEIFRIDEQNAAIGAFDVVNPPVALGETVSNEYGGVQFNKMSLYLSGMDYKGNQESVMQNYAELWGSVEGSPYWELLAYGSTSVIDAATNRYAFTIVEKLNSALYYEIDFILADKTAQFIGVAHTFATSDGATIKVATDGVATVSGGPFETEISLGHDYEVISLDSVMDGGVPEIKYPGFVYKFHISDAQNYYFYLSDTHNRELTLFTQLDHANTSGNQYSELYLIKNKEADDPDAIVLVFEASYMMGTNRLYTVMDGTISSVGDGLYRFDVDPDTIKQMKFPFGSYYQGKTLGDGSFCYRYVGENEFLMSAGGYVYPSSIKIRTYSDNVQIGVLESNEFGEATLTLNGDEMTGTLRRSMKAYHMNLNQYISGTKFSGNNRYIYMFTDEAEGGKSYTFISSDAIDAYLVDDDDLFGAYVDATGADTSYYYFFFENEVYYATIGPLGMQDASGSCRTGGHFEAVEGKEGLYKLSLVPDRSEPETVTRYLRLDEEPQSDGTYKKVFYVYREQLDLNFDVYEGRDLDTAKKVGNVFGDGYLNYLYTDEEDNEFEVYYTLLTVPTETNGLENPVLNIVYFDQGNEVAMIFDIVEKGEQQVAWLRTSIKQEIRLSARELRRPTRIVTDGHGTVDYYPTGTEETPVVGSLEDLGTSRFRFVPDDESKSNLSFVFTLYYMTNTNGEVTYYFYIEYFENFVGTFAAVDNYTALIMNGYDEATLIDNYGVAYNGYFYILGAKGSVVTFFNPALGYLYYTVHYSEDGKIESLTSYTDDFVVEGNVLLGYQGESKDVTGIPSGVDTIEALTFVNGDITSIDLKGIKHIGEYAFYECETLLSVTNTESIETVGEYAFGYCENLGGDLILTNLKRAELCAFYDCLYLENVHVGAHVEHIDSAAFGWMGGKLVGGTGKLDFFLHTDASANYDTMMSEEVFYNTDIRFYVDSAEVARAIYNSQMIDQVATVDVDSNNRPYPYWEVIRIANTVDDELFGEHGYYLSTLITPSTVNLLIHLDGQLTGGGRVSRVENGYHYDVYEIAADGKVTVLDYDPESGEISESEGHYDKDEQKFTIDGVEYWYFTDGAGSSRMESDTKILTFTNKFVPTEKLVLDLWITRNGDDIFMLNAEAYEGLRSLMTLTDEAHHVNIVGRYYSFRDNFASGSQGIQMYSLINAGSYIYFNFNGDGTYTITNQTTTYYNAEGQHIDLVKNFNAGSNSYTYTFRHSNSTLSANDITLDLSGYNVKSGSSQLQMTDNGYEGKFTVTSKTTAEEYEITVELVNESDLSNHCSFTTKSIVKVSA